MRDWEQQLQKGPREVSYSSVPPEENREGEIP